MVFIINCAGVDVLETEKIIDQLALFLVARFYLAMPHTGSACS
jgi:hypothetical protein